MQPKTQETAATAGNKRSSGSHPGCRSPAQTAKRQRTDLLAKPTIPTNDQEDHADNHSDRSFTAEPIVHHHNNHHNNSHVQTSFIPEVSLPSSIVLNHTQTSADTAEVKDEPLQVGEVGLELALDDGGNCVGDSENWAESAARLGQGALEDQGGYSKLNCFISRSSSC